MATCYGNPANGNLTANIEMSPPAKQATRSQLYQFLEWTRLGLLHKYPLKGIGNIFIELFFAILFRLATRLVEAIAVEPNRSFPLVLAIFVLVTLGDELFRCHDPHRIEPLGVKNEPIVVSEFVRDCCKQSCVAKVDIHPSGFDL